MLGPDTWTGCELIRDWLKSVAGGCATVQRGVAEEQRWLWAAAPGAAGQENTCFTDHFTLEVGNRDFVYYVQSPVKRQNNVEICLMKILSEIFP